MLLTLLQSQGAPPPPVDEESRGGYVRRRRARQREFDEERRVRAELRKLVARAVEPIDEPVQVVASAGNVVAVVPDHAGVAIPVPADFSVAEVARIVVDQLTAMGLEAERTRAVEAQMRARAIVDAHVAAQERLRVRRRREEEWLLLMD